MAFRIVITSDIISGNTYESLKIDNLINLTYKKCFLAIHEIVLVSTNVVIVSPFLWAQHLDSISQQQRFPASPFSFLSQKAFISQISILFDIDNVFGKRKSLVQSSEHII